MKYEVLNERTFSGLIRHLKETSFLWDRLTVLQNRDVSLGICHLKNVHMKSVQLSLKDTRTCWKDPKVSKGLSQRFITKLPRFVWFLSFSSHIFALLRWFPKMIGLPQSLVVPLSVGGPFAKSDITPGSASGKEGKKGLMTFTSPIHHQEKKELPPRLTKKSTFTPLWRQRLDHLWKRRD